MTKEIRSPNVENSQWCGRRFRHSDFVIPSDFVIRHSALRIAVCSIKRPVSGLARAAGGRFMENLLSFFRIHWDNVPLAIQRHTESADKSDALQTLRAVRRRPTVAKRLECVRLQRRFPTPGYDSMTWPVHGKPPFVFRMRWDHEPTRPCARPRRQATQSMTRTSTTTRTRLRFMERLLLFFRIHRGTMNRSTLPHAGSGDPAYIL
jgi:hypothetical protein